MIRNDMIAFRKSPNKNLLLLTLNCIAEKSGLPAIAAIKGVRRSFVNAVTTPPNAAPTTTPTARSTTFPRNRNCLNPSAIRFLLDLLCQNCFCLPQRLDLPQVIQIVAGHGFHDYPQRHL